MKFRKNVITILTKIGKCFSCLRMILDKAFSFGTPEGLYSLCFHSIKQSHSFIVA